MHMTERDTLRTFIPYGNCVPPDPTISPSLDGDTSQHEAFRAIDAGPVDESVFAAAAEACHACPQIDYCQKQRDEIGNALWRAGASTTIAGGDRVPVGLEPQNSSELETSAFQFDLSILPMDPAQYLYFLRQGVRSGQLRTSTRHPKNLPTMVDGYRDLLESRHPELFKAFTTTLNEQESEQALRRIIMGVAQQADFRRYSSGSRRYTGGVHNPRYNPDTHDYEAHYDAVELFMQEVIKLKEMGYARPGSMGMHYSAQYGRQLLDRFGPAFTRPGKHRPVARFYELIKGNIRDPEGVLTAFLAKVQAYRADGDDGPAWIAQKRAARMNRPPRGAERSRRQQLLDTHGYLGTAAVDKAIINYADAGERVGAVERQKEKLEGIYGKKHPIVTLSIIKHYASVPNCEEAVLAFIDRFKELKALYDKDADFMPSTMRRFALQSPKRSLTLAGDYKERLKQYRGWAAQASEAHFVPDSHLRQLALQGSVSSYENIVKEYRIKLLKTHLTHRNEGFADSDRLHVENWVFNRLKTFYDIAEIDMVGRSIIDLLGRGILTVGIAELSELHDQIIQLDVDRMADPGTRRYLTFASGLQTLTAQQRLAFAHDYNLARLLYGRPFTDGQLSAFLESTMPFEDKEHATVLFARLVSGEKRAAPIPFSVIQNDVVEFLQASVSAETETDVASESLQSDVITIVGADIVKLRQLYFEETDLSTFLPEAQSRWLEQELNARYTPLERAQGLEDVIMALHSGRLVIEDKKRAGYRLMLGDGLRDDHIDQVERAVIAQIMGVANLLYGKDLGLTLRYRVGANDLTAYAIKNILPKVRSWQNIETALVDIKATSVALQRLVISLDQPQLWHEGGKLIALSAQAVRQLQRQQYTDRPSDAWTSHQELTDYANACQNDLTAMTKGLPVKISDLMVCKLPDDEKVDLFYAPHISKMIRYNLSWLKK